MNDAAHFEKIAYDAFADELGKILAAAPEKVAALFLDPIYDSIIDELGADYVKSASDDELEELVKTAFISAAIRKFPVLGMPARQGLKTLGGQAVHGVKTMGTQASTAVRHQLMPAAGRMANSQNRFVQGMGDSLMHKAETSPMRAILNPVGTAAEIATASGGHMAAQGLANRGAQMASAAPAGGLRQRFGSGMQRTFTAGGAGHTALTSALPRAAEIAGAVGTGSALHVPVGVAGILGKGATAAGVGGLKAMGATAAADAVAHGAHTLVGHGVEDAVGTLKQNLAARRLAHAPAGVHH